MGFFSKKQKNVSDSAIYKMITDTGNGYFAWNGKLYQSDMVRACIKPRAKAIGKMVAKHIRETETSDGKKIEINPMVYIRMMLEEPNPYMSFQVMIEKTVNQLSLNGNAFILILRDGFDKPVGLYPIVCSGVEAINRGTKLFLKFYLVNGKIMECDYTDIIHIRDDFFNNDIFGDSPNEALKGVMNVAGYIDQGLISAIKNGGIIKWLLKFTTSMRDEDLKTKASEFAENYLSMSSSSMGVAAVDSKADIQQITTNDYVPESKNVELVQNRIYDFFNTNPNIVNSTFDENEWLAYYEAVIEPIGVQLSNEFSRKLFSRKERAYGNKIVFESANLTYASMSTKLSLVSFVDRGIMTPNEVRYYMNLAPIDGGDIALLRKDTGVLVEGGGEE